MRRPHPADQETIYRIVLKREILTTNDGSTTIHISDWNESYHSRHGAIQEAMHVFIKNGLNLFSGEVAIMEIGFGTGLNAFVTFLASSEKNQKINYTGVEAFPITEDEIAAMNFSEQLSAGKDADIFKYLHEVAWEQPAALNEHFTLIKRKQLFQQIDDLEKYDLIYFDAFGYDVQPELWSTDIFRRMHKALKPSGALVTYAARGVVKRSMLEVGFTVEKLPGPPGKREMFRGFKAAPH